MILKGTEVFKGLLVQARLMADQKTPVGNFTAGGVVKLSACDIPSVSRPHEAHVGCMLYINLAVSVCIYRAL